ncbi:Cys-tRNA(Pro)/Cys-tRNA(Cys) deacylase YbaK [Corynebacterium capitovis DSM 44611]|uniref:aminoacyl-tRNA deacylase n=1 Tax=Corynebacterium capitovis TaxID=131081 RepID=UPI000382DB5F|nr:aminoacyl-tRNA deacylase [Corynebacterium capitovis]WKD57047.1 Cys-tRNA(Pro)/Cys-tRNA(Cys) deacylase YbaK [Corynebacterium capitovis DSM 44611]
MARRTRALEALADTPHEVLTYTPSQDHFGEHSTHELQISPHEVLKTLVVAGPGTELALCCVPVATRLSLKHAAQALGWKRAEMSDPARAQRATGYVVGGISPLGTATQLRTLLDASIADLDTVTVSAGQRGLSVQLAPGDLAALTGAQFADISSG